MFIDSLESHHTEDIEPVKMLVKQKTKAVPEVESSPTTIFAPMSAPPAMKLPEALPEPRLPRASVWLHGEKGTWPVLLVPLIPRVHCYLPLASRPLGIPAALDAQFGIWAALRIPDGLLLPLCESRSLCAS